MFIQKFIVLQLALVISFYDKGAVAWISNESVVHPTLSSTDRNTEQHRRLAIAPLSLSEPKQVPYAHDEEGNHDLLSNSGNRRSFLKQSQHILLLPTVALFSSSPVSAKYGEGTSMELPSYIDYLIDKNTAADNSKALYKGADPATVLRRVAESERRLGEVAELAEKKKWSQINGLITGPLGTLSSSLNQIVAIVSPSSTQKKTKQVEQAVKKVKADILAIGQAADRKNAEGCVQQAQLASNDLKNLLEIAFE